jgi:hypothetical protein
VTRPLDVTWRDVAFNLDDDLAAEVAAAWRWLVPDMERILTCSMFGGLFFEDASGRILWLECPMGEVKPVATSAEEFDQLLKDADAQPGSTLVSKWFLPHFVEQLMSAGRRPELGECYGLKLRPIFVGGNYSIENSFVLSAREWLLSTAHMHRQIADLPDGTQVQFD